MLHLFLISFLAIVLPGVFGFGVLNVIFWKKILPYNLPQILGLSCGLGIGIYTILLFLLGWIGVSISLIVTVSLMLALFVIGILFYVFSRKRLEFRSLFGIPNNIKLGYFSFACLFFLVISFFFIFYIPLHTPTYPDDAFFNWNFRAKVIYSTKSLNLHKPQDGRLFNGGAQNNYPLLIGLYKVYIANIIGEYDDRWVNIVSPLFHLLTSLLLFGFLFKKFGSKYAFGALVLYNMMPLLWIHAINTYAEMVLIFYFLAASMVLYEYFSSNQRNIVILAGILLALASWTKNEGMVAFTPAVFGGVIGATFLPYVLEFFTKTAHANKSHFIQKSKDALYFLLSYGAVIVFWVIFREIYHLGIGAGGSNVMNGNFGFEFHPEAFPAIKVILFQFAGYSILPTVFLGTIVIFAKEIFKNKKYFFLFCTNILAFLIITSVFLFTENYLSPLHGDSRQYMMIMPEVFLLISLLFGSQLKPSKIN